MVEKRGVKQDGPLGGSPVEISYRKHGESVCNREMDDSVDIIWHAARMLAR